MSKLYGVMRGAARNEVTRRGHREIRATVASWNGAIQTSIYIDDQGVEHYAVSQIPWHGAGVSRGIETGIVGKVPSLMSRLSETLRQLLPRGDTGVYGSLLLEASTRVGYPEIEQSRPDAEIIKDLCDAIAAVATQPVCDTI